MSFTEVLDNYAIEVIAVTEKITTSTGICNLAPPKTHIVEGGSKHSLATGGLNKYVDFMFYCY